jgi:tetratricopeptide (TPR) repeat protein
VAIVKKLLQQKPDDDEVLFELSRILLGKDQLAESLDVLRKALGIGRRTDLVHNNIAWDMLFFPTVDPRALEHAEQAVALSQRKNGASLHTLATVLAELARPEEARQTLLEVFDAEAVDSPRSIDWYVIGRIAEEYGERTTALSAYRKVEKNPDEGPLSTYRLAERRLRLMEGKAK